MIFLQSAILFVCGFTLWILAYITHRIERLTMSTQEAIDAVVTKLGAVREEIVAKLAEVQAQLDAANVPAEVVDLSALTAAAQALDDIVPDSPVTPSE